VRTQIPDRKMMNFKHCLLALVILFAPPVWAGWTFVTQDVDGNSFFIDFETLRKEGNLRKVWGKTELSKVNKFDWSSTRQRNEFDCKNETKTILSVSAFSKGNLQGEKLFDANKITDKEDVAPDSVDWSILKLVCSK
jgi:hypothetical protein